MNKIADLTKTQETNDQKQKKDKVLLWLRLPLSCHKHNYSLRKSQPFMYLVTIHRVRTSNWDESIIYLVSVCLFACASGRHKPLRRERMGGFRFRSPFAYQGNLGKIAR